MTSQQVAVIWVDGTFEGNKYQSMKDEFNERISITEASPTDTSDMNALICAETKQDLVDNGVILITVDTEEQAIQQIRAHSTAKIFLMSSGSLGKIIVPKVVQEYSLIHSFYIFCFKMTIHSKWASEFADCLQMFDHPVDLLVRLMRDISQFFIEQGKAYLQLEDPNMALSCFRHAYNLEISANQRDKMTPNTKTGKAVIQPDFRRHLDLLEGENGLIRQAERALNNE